MENMNNEIMEVETMEMDNYDAEIETSENGGGLGKVVLGVGLALAAGAVALGVKNKDKFKAWNTERKIKKLEKDGFVVVSPEEVAAAEQEIEGEEVIDIPEDKTEE